MSYVKSSSIGINSHLCNESNTSKDNDEHHAPYKLMFLFFILFIGCMSFSLLVLIFVFSFLITKGLCKTLFAPLRIPYTGVIIFISFIGGILFNIFIHDDTFLILTTSSPDLLIGIFLPILVFESAYRTEYHAFIKSLYSILFLSIIGYFISVFSITILNKYLFFFQHWTFLQCLALGMILSATRPVTLMRPAG
jgi:NhaP-type Na+/H+ or K+/H+ antiporter